MGAHMEPYTWDDLGSQGALSPGCFGFGHDGHSRDTLVGHVSVDCMSADIAPDMTSSTDEEDVQVLVDMTECCVGIPVDNPTIGTKRQLPSLPSHSEGLPHQAVMPMEIRQQELPVEVSRMLGGTTAVRLGGANPGKAVKATGRYFVRLSGVYKGTHPGCVMN